MATKHHNRAKKRLAINSRTIGTAHLNGALENHFTARPAKPEDINADDQVEREEAAYRRYLSAVNKNKMPYSRELRRVMTMFPRLKHSVLDRRIMVLFQHDLPNREGEARGWLKTPGNVRERKGVLRSFGDVIVLDSELLKSPLAVGCILAHELGHVAWREHRHNGKPKPKNVAVKGDSALITNEENWCDFTAGKFLFRQGYRKRAAARKKWGDLRGFKGILNYKLHLYEKGAAAIRQRQTSNGKVHVSGYTRADGVEVKSHYRSRPSPNR